MYFTAAGWTVRGEHLSSWMNVWNVWKHFSFGQLTKYEEVSMIENWLDVQSIQNVHWQNQASQISVDSGLLSKWKVWPSDKHAVPRGSIPKNANLFGKFFPNGDPTPPFKECWSECKVIFWLFWKFEGDFRVTKFWDSDHPPPLSVLGQIPKLSHNLF